MKVLWPRSLFFLSLGKLPRLVLGNDIFYNTDSQTIMTLYGYSTVTAGPRGHGGSVSMSTTSSCFRITSQAWQPHA